MTTEGEGPGIFIDEADEHEDCEFCQGSQAARDGLAQTDNPYPRPDVDPKSAEWWDEPHALWEFGFHVERNAPWRQRGRASPNRLT